MIPAVLERCAGIDVGKRFVVACCMVGPADREPKTETRQFGTASTELEELHAWLRKSGCTDVVMESTGSYWKPVFNVLEEDLNVVLVNARVVKNLPGYKTDRKDGKRLAHLFRHGLIRGSFIPPKPIRELRDLTRRRKQLLSDGTSERNRIQKVLEDANVKLGNVLTDVFGISGQAMLEALLEGRGSSEQIAELARGRLRRKVPEIAAALQNHRLNDHHRFLIRQALHHLDFPEQEIQELDGEILHKLEPYADQFQRLQEIPGIAASSAASIIAEIGTRVEQFPSTHQLASWAGICPGNNESAGKHFGGRTRKGDHWLRAALTECAWGAARKKNSFFQSRFRRLTARRGVKRALLATAHSLLVVVYYVLFEGAHYRELGANYLDEKRRDTLIRHHVKRLRELGLPIQTTTPSQVSWS